MARNTPLLREGVLTYECEGISYRLIVGTSQWQKWLEDATAFVVVDECCTFTARKERAGNRRGSRYWRAYYKYRGRLYRIYIGKTHELTLARLREIALLLTEQHGSSSQPASEKHLCSQVSTPFPPALDRRIQQQDRQYITSQRHHPILLKTKLSVPPPRSHIITRYRLSQRLQQVTEHKLVLVSAPAGFGKTTVVSEWARTFLGEMSETSSSLAWLSLDRGDDDATSFWTYCIAALDSVQPGIGDDALALLFSAQPVSIQTVLSVLLNALNTLTGEFVLVLDDYQLIETQAIHEGVAFLLQHMPASMHLIISTRTEPDLPLARLRACNTLLELRTADLRFTREEVEDFLRLTLNMTLPPEASAALELRTEGWAAGLQLASLSLKGQEDIVGYITVLAGNHRHILDYLVEEVFARQPEHIQSFLLQTCILNRLNGSLCSTLTGLSNGQEMLNMLEQKNLFLVPLDAERKWYRYHHLFADVLRNFAQGRDPVRIPELHRRASSWYEQHGLDREAIEHAIAAGDVERTANLLEQFADSSIWAYGEAATVQRWLASLPEQVIYARPQLCILKAWMLQYSLGYKAVERSSAQAIYTSVEAYLQNAHRLLALDNTLPGNRAMRGEAAALLSLLFFSRNEIERIRKSARLALELLPQENKTLRCLAARMLFNIYSFYGDTSGIEPAMQELTLISRISDDVFSRLNALLSIASYQGIRGELKQAAASHREALHYVEERLKTISIASPHSIGLSSILLEWNDLPGAEQYLLQAIEHLKKRGDPYVLVESYYLLASLRQAQGDYEGIYTALEEEQQVMHSFQQYPLKVFMRTLEAQRAWLSLLKGESLTATQWADNYKLSAEQHFLSQYVELTILVRVYLATRKSEEALQIVAQLLSRAEGMHHVHQSIQLLSLQALALSAQGNKVQAVRTLARALALAEPGGYIRTFINEGVPMATLLLQVLEAVQIGSVSLASEVSLHYLHTLLTASGVAITLPASAKGTKPPDTPQKRQLTILPKLSERELELLRLIALGYSDRDIAQHLMLAESTIKTYAKRLYARLNVKNRTQAVTRARALHLL